MANKTFDVKCQETVFSLLKNCLMCKTYLKENFWKIFKVHLLN